MLAGILMFHTITDLAVADRNVDAADGTKGRSHSPITLSSLDTRAPFLLVLAVV